MRNDRHIALKLRRQGESYNKISKEVGVPKSTLSNWFSDVAWSQEIKKELSKKANYIARKRLRLVNKERREAWERQREGARQGAKKDFSRLSRNPLFIAGINLYWGEGDSKVENGLVRLANTSPKMIRVFSRFLKETLKVQPEKMRVSLVLYPDLSEKTCRLFWSKVAQIPLSQFHKTQFIEGRHPTKRSEHGICTLVVSNRELKEKISTWIYLFGEQYARE